ncbi:hypothetical protein SAMN06265375_1011443 [Muriicola jejuensis]|uniref:peptidylprolyl isomerase n=1 Tax=Muriicola jejuensis TaxID=504488 RepID=A0A6P0U7L1_9FLAO|nr:hypothetical protein [Muriicola jejuensis]NER09074.1 hypothetical protein [Muriicola jejuensis]SMP11442.1 hypothetical protein SAMN06265375_1011443 [Muriicola jejuensis]
MLKYFALPFLILLMISCGNDDNDVTKVPPEKLVDQVIIDDAELTEYLATHFYEIENGPNGRINFILDTIAGDNAGKTPLLSQVSSKVINVSSIQFLLNDEEVDVPHKLYYLVLEGQEGVGESPTIADSVFVRYQGRLLNGISFDASSTGAWFDLPRLQFPQQGARGFAEGLTFFKSGMIASEQPSDGSYLVEDFGAGLIFMPSGLAYFNQSPTGIPFYSPLIFEINLLTVKKTDHDQDGIPSILEDVNQNGYLPDDNTDAESERNSRSNLVADYQDPDDDGDGVLTRTEISDADGNIILPYPDSNNDGIPDYLDPDIKRNPNN